MTPSPQTISSAAEQQFLYIRSRQKRAGLIYRNVGLAAAYGSIHRFLSYVLDWKPIAKWRTLSMAVYGIGLVHSRPYAARNLRDCDRHQRRPCDVTGSRLGAELITQKRRAAAA